MKAHHIYGPVPEDVFKEAISLPAGQAAKVLRKYDPAFGRGKDGELKPFKVKVERTVEMRRYDHAEITIDAVDEDEARELINLMDQEDINWSEGDYGHEDVWSFDVLWVKETT